MIKEVWIYLMVQIANRFPVNKYPCGVPTNTIQITGSSQPNADGTYVKQSDIMWAGPNYTFGPNFVQYFLSYLGGVWYLVQSSSLAGNENEYQATSFPCTWTTKLSSPPAPTGAYV